MKGSFSIMKRIRNLVHSESGGALAELALMVPFLAVMLAGVSEFGRFFQNYTTVAKGTRSAARYLSNHQLNSTELGRARSLVVCGKLTCAGGDELVKGVGAGPSLSASNVCIESTGSPKVLNVTVRIPRVSGDCPTPGWNNLGGGNPTPYPYQPVFDVGALLQTTFTMALPISPSTTMYYMID